MGDKVGASENVHTPMGESKGRWSADFEALFIPDSSLRVKMIASQLAFYDVKAVQLIGTSLWHSSDLLKKGAEYLEGAVFPDTFSGEWDPAGDQRFCRCLLLGIQSRAR